MGSSAAACTQCGATELVYASGLCDDCKYQPREFTYSEDLPTAPGYYVYRLWDADGKCMYVGMVGDNVPRRLSARLGQHRRDKTWWPAVARIDAATCAQFTVHEEEARQIEALRPYRNRRHELWALPWMERAAAREALRNSVAP